MPGCRGRSSKGLPPCFLQAWTGFAPSSVSVLFPIRHVAGCWRNLLVIFCAAVEVSSSIAAEADMRSLMEKLL